MTGFKLFSQTTLRISHRGNNGFSYDFVNLAKALYSLANDLPHSSCHIHRDNDLVNVETLSVWFAADNRLDIVVSTHSESLAKFVEVLNTWEKSIGVTSFTDTSIVTYKVETESWIEGCFFDVDATPNIDVINVKMDARRSGRTHV